MPIRFRCVYCEQLLGIARRKAGTVVKCPNCAGQLIVPAPDAATINSTEEDDDATAAAPDKEDLSARTAQAPAKVTAAAGAKSDATEAGLLFERNDFDELLRPAVAKRNSGSGPAARTAPKPQPQPPPQPFDFAAAPAVQLAPVPAKIPATPPPMTARRSGIFLSPLLIVLLLGFIFVSVSGAFVVGLLVGKMIPR